MDEIDKRQQSEIDAAAKKNAAQDEKDNEHDRKFNRYLIVTTVFFAWLSVLSLATFLSIAVENKITITVEPRR